MKKGKGSENDLSKPYEGFDEILFYSFPTSAYTKIQIPWLGTPYSFNFICLINLLLSLYFGQISDSLILPLVEIKSILR